MSKTLVFCMVVAGSIGATVATVEAREISVWGNHFTVDDGPAVVAPRPQGFKALVGNPDRDDRRLPVGDEPLQ